MTKVRNGEDVYMYSVAVYQKYITRLGRAVARKLSFLPTELDIFDIRNTSANPWIKPRIIRNTSVNHWIKPRMYADGVIC